MAIQLTLYGEKHWDSPYVFSCYVALKEKGLPFTEAEIDLAAGEQRQPAYLRNSLIGKVPALVHDDFWLTESMAIAEYLAETFPAPDYPRLFPADLRERARARQIMMWIRSDLQALREERPTSTMFYGAAATPLTPKGAEAAAKLVRVASAVIPPGKTTMFGAWCLADADLAFTLHRLLLNGHEVPPGVRAYAEANWTRPSVQAFVMHPRPAAHADY